MDLSKAFACVNHDLLIAKLNAYGLNIKALQLIRNYLSNRKQRVKINSSFSDWKEKNLEYLGTPPKVLCKRLKEIGIETKIVELQKTAILNSARILRKVLEF